jgi:RNA binding exosome subunit
LGWEEDFEKWKDGKSPVSAEEVKRILDHVFGGRVEKGTKHRWKVDVRELRGLPGFQLPFITVPLKGGQKVKGPYLQTLYKAATHELLELYQTLEDRLENEQND